MYKYFVAYSHLTEGRAGFGSTVVDMSTWISGQNVLDRVAEAIENKCSVENVVILNYKLIDNKESARAFLQLKLGDDYRSVRKTDIDYCESMEDCLDLIASVQGSLPI